MLTERLVNKKKFQFKVNQGIELQLLYNAKSTWLHSIVKRHKFDLKMHESSLFAKLYFIHSKKNCCAVVFNINYGRVVQLPSMLWESIFKIVKLSSACAKAFRCNCVVHKIVR